MNKEILKSALLQTADEKLFENIPENLPKAQVSEKLKKRLNNIGAKKKKKVGMIAAAVAVVLLATPVIYTQFKAPDFIKDPVTPETHTVSKKPTSVENIQETTQVNIKVEPTIKTSNNESITKPQSPIKEDDLVIDKSDFSTTTKPAKTTESTLSKEYENNLKLAGEQDAILKSIKGFDDYYKFLDDKGRLNILYWNNESYEILKKHLDSNIVIFKKVKFSNDYLSKIEKALFENKDEFDIYLISSGNKNNQVTVITSNGEKVKGILKFLNENIENFDKEAVDIMVSNEKVEED